MPLAAEGGATAATGAREPARFAAELCGKNLLKSNADCRADFCFQDAKGRLLRVRDARPKARAAACAGKANVRAKTEDERLQCCGNRFGAV